MVIRNVHVMRKPGITATKVSASDIRSSLQIGSVEAKAAAKAIRKAMSAHQSAHGPARAERRTDGVRKTVGQKPRV